MGYCTVTQYSIHALDLVFQFHYQSLNARTISVKVFVTFSLCSPEGALVESFFAKAMDKLSQTDLAAASKHLVFDLAHFFVPHLSLDSLCSLLSYLTPLLDVSQCVSAVVNWVYLHVGAGQKEMS